MPRGQEKNQTTSRVGPAFCSVQPFPVVSILGINCSTPYTPLQNLNGWNQKNHSKLNHFLRFEHVNFPGCSLFNVGESVFLLATNLLGILWAVGINDENGISINLLDYMQNTWPLSHQLSDLLCASKIQTDQWSSDPWIIWIAMDITYLDPKDFQPGFGKAGKDWNS